MKNIDTIEACNEPMMQLGYRPRGECLDNAIPGTPGRFYFSKDTDGVRTHQVHVCQEGHYDIEDKLAFRDYLRAHPGAAQAYSRLKERLAIENRHDIVGYIQGKDAFVQGIIAKATVWRQKAGGYMDGSSLQGLTSACTLTAIRLRSMAAGDAGRYASTRSGDG